MSADAPSPPEASSPPRAQVLVEAALALVPEPVAQRLRGGAELGAVLETLLEASASERAAYGVAEEELLRALVRPLSTGADLEPLRALHAADLALTLGCAKGNPAALAELDRRLRSELTPALRRVDPSPGFVDEALQGALERLLLPDKDGGGKVSTYSGVGPLARWLRTVALRVALNLRRGDRSPVALDEQLAEGLAWDAPGAEASLLKHQYREAFQQSFRAALADLTDQELNVLRLHYVGGLSLERLGDTYGVHRATVARWIVRAKELVLLGTQRKLQARLNVGPDEFQSIMNLVKSQLVLTLSRALA